MDTQALTGSPAENFPKLRSSAMMDAASVLSLLGSGTGGLSATEASRRVSAFGKNVLHAHRAKPWHVLGRQLKSPVLILLFVTAGVSAFLGEAANAIIIGVILAVSVGLGFVNEFRAEKAADALHDQIRHTVIALRDGGPVRVDVTELALGDVVQLTMGTVVPADMRLISAHDLSCDEALVTGESLPTVKTPEPITADTGTGDLTSCLLMGTIVQSGSATAVVVATGSQTEFGRIASGLATQQPPTEFQHGLARFSVLLLEVAVALTTLIFIANMLLQRPILDSLLFSLAIAVGITPQLLPAVVSASLSFGSRALAKRQVLVKRLICIEDLGDMDILVTDKTGTLTEGRISYTSALPADSETTSDMLFLLGLLATETDYSSAQGAVLGMNPLDSALWDAPRPDTARPEAFQRIDLLPFDHERRKTTVLVETPTHERLVITKGSPEDVLRACSHTPPAAQEILEREYQSGSRVIAVATKIAKGLQQVTAADESELTLVGFLVFLDRPKSDARASLEQVAMLGISVKIATGDSALVAEKVLTDLGLSSGGTLSGVDIEAMSDDSLREAVSITTIFARVSPEQKARIIRLLRHSGRSVGFMGDGVNDALALHQADIGISVESAADVAKDAADVLLLDKDLSALANGVTEGRRIFANTIKYVLMGTSSNFGNMFSASVASVVLPFLPMLPGQILLNNLLYDTGQLAIPSDRVDKEQLLAPSHWNIGFISRFMLLFGPISSAFDFATFTLMMLVFHAAEGEFQAGWFIESLATQTLIIFAIRTRRVPFFRSRPSLGLTLATLTVVGLGVWLPNSPAAGLLGFTPLPAPFFLALLAMVVTYMVMVELAKAWFFSRTAQHLGTPPPVPQERRQSRHVHRRSARFTGVSPATSRS